MIPFLEPFYHRNHFLISLIFIAPASGYITSAFLNNYIHMTSGRRGVAFLAPGIRLVAYVGISQHPPYPALIICHCLAAVGVGMEDAAWNAWIGVMQNANELLGFLHGFYGLGATLGPLISTSMITKGGLGWYTFYYVMIGFSCLELVLAATAFWTETAAKYRAEHEKTTDKMGGQTREALQNKVTWICAFFLLVYVGVEVAVAGWVVQFMREVRHAGPFQAGMSATVYWLGLTVGRVVLGFVTPRIGEKLAILIYLALASTSHLLFWLLPSFPISATFAAILGFFLGPLFPAAVVVATQLLPQHLHVGSIGFAAAFGSAGACVLPFAVGAIAQVKGVGVLMPIVLSMLVVDAVIWATLPGIPRTKKDAQNRIDGLVPPG